MEKNGISTTQNLSWRMTLLWDFEIQTDHLISARRQDLMIINNNNNKRTCRIVNFAVPADYRVKLKESKKKDKYLDLAKELKKLWNMKVTGILIVIGALGSHQRIGTRTGVQGNKKTSGDYLNYSIIEIGQNTEKSSGDLRRLAVTQTPVRIHRLTLVWKTGKGVNKNNNNVTQTPVKTHQLTLMWTTHKE